MIENYSITEWIAFFFIYSFLGWCIESAIVSFNKRKLTNRGFLKGPMLPLYGSGAVIMLLSTLWAKDNYVLVYICGTIGATALEYVTGVLMEMMFNMRYWDYSNKKFQIHGYICLTSSLFWGVLTVLLVCFVHIPVAALVASVPAHIPEGWVHRTGRPAWRHRFWPRPALPCSRGSDVPPGRGAPSPLPLNTPWPV